VGVEITGWGTALPEKKLTSAELAERFDVTEDWIVKRTGIRARRIAGPDDTSSSLATAAGAEAIKTAGITPDELGLVLVATCTPDLQLPSTAGFVQSELGAINAGACDLEAACAGFVYALAQCAALIEVGTVRNVLVCGAEVLSRITDYSDLSSCVLFGDGAGALVLQHTDAPTRLGPFKLHHDGARADLLYIPPDKGVMYMDGREVYRHAVAGMSSSVAALLSEVDMDVDDVDLVVAHQANRRILEAVGKKLGADPARIFIGIEEVGNTSAASIPLALVHAASGGRLEPGHRAVVTAFGAGFAWGSGMLQWGRAETSNGSTTTKSG
jgi:3-oxoacyl-[acyl-carrier-protein] synthase-3